MRTARFTSLPLALIAGSAAGSAALAQAASPPAKARSVDPLPCSRAAAPELQEAIKAAEGVFDASWQAVGAARATVFRTKPEPVNPFAPRDPKAEPPAPVISGVIHAASVGCAYFPVETDTVVWFVGTGVRFHESGKWSAPLSQGLLMGVRVRRVDGVTKAIVDPSTPTVVLPDAILAKPEAKDIPPLQAPTTAKAKKR